jgi:hypothetical protein
LSEALLIVTRSSACSSVSPENNLRCLKHTTQDKNSNLKWPLTLIMWPLTPHERNFERLCISFLRRLADTLQVLVYRQPFDLCVDCVGIVDERAVLDRLKQRKNGTEQYLRTVLFWDVRRLPACGYFLHCVVFPLWGPKRKQVSSPVIFILTENNVNSVIIAA